MSASLKLFDVIDVRIADVVDIVLISLVLYYVFLLFRGTRAVQMFFGFGLLILGWLLANWWELHGVAWLFSNLATVGLVALVILFQPELRGALSRVGQMVTQADLRHFFFHPSGLEDVADQIVSAVQDLARNHYGALIVLEKRVGLRNYADNGQWLDAKLSAKLLRSLFFPNSPLHDGAVILAMDRILAAGCILPLPLVGGEQDTSIGMRHRAAKAMAAESDSLVVVVSEESGTISIAYRNTLRRKVSLKELEEEIKRHWHDLFET